MILSEKNGDSSERSQTPDKLIPYAVPGLAELITPTETDSPELQALLPKVYNEFIYRKAGLAQWLKSLEAESSPQTISQDRLMTELRTVPDKLRQRAAMDIKTREELLIRLLRMRVLKRLLTSSGISEAQAILPSQEEFFWLDIALQKLISDLGSDLLNGQELASEDDFERYQVRVGEMTFHEFGYYHEVYKVLIDLKLKALAKTQE